MSYDEMELDMIGDQRTAMFVIPTGRPREEAEVIL